MRMKFGHTEGGALLIAAAALVLCAAQVRGQSYGGSYGTTTAPATSRQTAEFIKQAARNNEMEVALGQIGARKAQDPSLRTFSQQVQQDHSRANQRLKPIANQYLVWVKQPLTPQDKNELSLLSSLSGKQFDQRLATDFMETHQKGITLYKGALAQPQPIAVRQYVGNTLPHMQRHLQRAATLASNVGVSQATIAAITGQAAPPAVGGASITQEPERGVGNAEKTESGAGAKQQQQNTEPASR